MMGKNQSSAGLCRVGQGWLGKNMRELQKWCDVCYFDSILSCTGEPFCLKLLNDIFKIGTFHFMFKGKKKLWTQLLWMRCTLLQQLVTPTTISSGFSFKLPTVVFIPGPSPILDSYHLNLCEALHKLRI